jgi:hypothetical protein
MYCDLCNSPITERNRAVISSQEMHNAIRKGFNPFKALGIPPSRDAQRPLEELFQSWRRTALIDKTGWGLCSECVPAFRRGTQGVVLLPSSLSAMDDQRSRFVSVFRSVLAEKVLAAAIDDSSPLLATNPTAPLLADDDAPQACCLREGADESF